jgi:hypothetical protein
MSILSKLFKSSPEKRNIHEIEFKPITGGDGSSIEHAAIINCSSTNTMNMLIDKFICDRHGNKGESWICIFESFVVTDEIKSGNIRRIAIESNNENITYYFDVSKPMKATMQIFNNLNN